MSCVYPMHYALGLHPAYRPALSAKIYFYMCQHSFLITITSVQYVNYAFQERGTADSIPKQCLGLQFPKHHITPMNTPSSVHYLSSFTVSFAFPYHLVFPLPLSGYDSCIFSFLFVPVHESELLALISIPL